MTTLTIHFENPEIEPIVVKDCDLCDFSDDYALPAGEGHVDRIAQAMRAQSNGELHTEWYDGIDSYVMFNQEDKLFTIWTGSGENKGRDFRLDPEFPLPYMERIEVSEDEDDDEDATDRIAADRGTAEDYGITQAEFDASMDAASKAAEVSK